MHSSHYFLVVCVTFATSTVVKAQDADWASAGPALVAGRPLEARLYDAVTNKLWTAFVLRENLLQVFEAAHSGPSGDPNMDQSNEYLYEAFKYRRIDTFPLLQLARCLAHQEQSVQLDLALQLLANSSHKYIRCIIEVAQEAVRSNQLSAADEGWDLLTDLKDLGMPLLKAITRPVYRPVKLNTTQSAIDAVWTNITAGHYPPQRLIGMVLLNTPSSVPALADQLYLGHFLYLEKLPAAAWEAVLAAVPPPQHPSFMAFLKDVLSQLPAHLPADISFAIAPAKYVETPQSEEEFRKMAANLSRYIVAYKQNATSSRRTLGKTKRTLDGGSRAAGNSLELTKLKQSLLTAVEAPEFRLGPGKQSSHVYTTPRPKGVYNVTPEGTTPSTPGHTGHTGPFLVTVDGWQTHPAPTTPTTSTAPTLA